MLKDLIKNVPWKKVATWVGYGATAALAVAKSVSEHRKAEEFDSLKEAVKELQEK